MNDLDPEDRALVDLARDGHEPSDVDRRRLRTALAASLGAASGLVTTTAIGTSAAAAGVGVAGSVPAVTKLIAAVIVAAAVGGGGVIVYRTARSEKADRAERPIAARAPLANPGGARPAVPPERASVPALPPPAEPEPAGSARSDSAVPRSPRRVERAALPAVDPPAAAGARASAQPAAPGAPIKAALTATTIEEETRLVRGGIAALHAGAPALALTLFDDHARRYPDGVLAEERSAERVIALHDLGRHAQADAAAAAFLRAYPGSPLATRVREASNRVGESVTDGPARTP